jgi:GxxExxY protein
MSNGQLIADDLTRSVIGAYFEVYNELGFGFLEHVHATAMERELGSRGHIVAREQSVIITYKNERLCTQRLDMVVDNRLIVEIKSTTSLPPTALRQLYNYLCATEFELGILFHFGPAPKFYRQILTNDRKQSRKRKNPSAEELRDSGHAAL